jgi:hypothetical protein
MCAFTRAPEAARFLQQLLLRLPLDVDAPERRTAGIRTALLGPRIRWAFVRLGLPVVADSLEEVLHGCPGRDAPPGRVHESNPPRRTYDQVQSRMTPYAQLPGLNT